MLEESGVQRLAEDVELSWKEVKDAVSADRVHGRCAVMAQCACLVAMVVESIHTTSCYYCQHSPLFIFTLDSCVISLHVLAPV